MKSILIPFLTTLMIMVIQNRCQDHGHDHIMVADPEIELLAYTLYTEKTELFVDFKPLVVGQESRFATHFTALGESFKAVSKGSVTLTRGALPAIKALPPIRRKYRAYFAFV